MIYRSREDAHYDYNTWRKIEHCDEYHPFLKDDMIPNKTNASLTWGDIAFFFCVACCIIFLMCLA